MNINGSCHCSSVKITTNKESIQGIVKCYCFDCQKHLGNFAPWVVCEKTDTTIVGSVGEYQSSEGAHRIFCTDCGTSIAKRPIDGTKILIAAGTLTQPVDVEVIKEVFVEQKQGWM